MLRVALENAMPIGIETMQVSFINSYITTQHIIIFWQVLNTIFDNLFLKFQLKHIGSYLG